MIDPYNQNQLQPNMINPSAMSNMQTLQGINGTPMMGTANRIMQPSPGAIPSPSPYGMPQDPTMQNLPPGIMSNNNY
jgi:hypothetical protein